MPAALLVSDFGNWKICHIHESRAEGPMQLMSQTEPFSISAAQVDVGLRKGLPANIPHRQEEENTSLEY